MLAEVKRGWKRVALVLLLLLLLHLSGIDFADEPLAREEESADHVLSLPDASPE